MKIQFPHSQWPITRLVITGPGVELKANAEHSVPSFEFDLPGGVDESELSIVAQHISSGGQVVGESLVQVAVEKKIEDALEQVPADVDMDAVVEHLESGETIELTSNDEDELDEDFDDEDLEDAE